MVYRLRKTPLRRWLYILSQAILLIISWAFIFEIGLRTQQYFGPLYDLEMKSVNLNPQDLNSYSDVVNHRPISGIFQLMGRTKYGDLDGFTFKRSYDDTGVRITDDKEFLAGCRKPASVLFLGDSFMQGYDDKDTLPYHVAKYFKTELNI